MKKHGFTITEMIVALGIIGVVASLTLPNFISQGRNDAYAKKLATTVSTLETAFTSMMATEGVQTMSETEFIDNPSTTTICENGQTCTQVTDDYGNSKAIFARYIKVNSSSNIISDVYGNIKHKDLFPFSNTLNFEDAADCVLQLKNGANVGIKFDGTMEIDDAVASANGISTNKLISIITIDVNGISGPNIWGRDSFVFYLGDDGNLHPYGGKVFSIVGEADDWATDESMGCNDTAKNLGCAGRLVENNYEVDY